jgi:hypothetical protein
VSKSRLMFACGGLTALIAILCFVWGAWQAVIQHYSGLWNDAAVFLWIYTACFFFVGIVFNIAGSRFSTRPSPADTVSFLNIAAACAAIAALLFIVQFWRAAQGFGGPDMNTHWADPSALFALIAVVCAVRAAVFPPR